MSFSPESLAAMGARLYDVGNVGWASARRPTRVKLLESAPRMASKNIVHVVGTGTIGEPLIGLFTKYKEKWGIDEVTFHKRTPAANDRAMIEHLIGRGGKLTVDEGAREEFALLGHRVSYTTEEASERATVVVDCTPAGNDNKAKYYDR